MAAHHRAGILVMTGKDTPMTDSLPAILYSLDRAGAPVALVERRIEIGDQTAMLDRYPALLDAAHVLELARLVNHFAREFRYDVIDDPAAFEAAYRAQIAAEDPKATWQQGNPRLRDFGMPDFAAIRPPRFEGGRLVFYARSRQYGVPYRVEVPIDGTAVGAAVYEPVAMGPVP